MFFFFDLHATLPFPRKDQNFMESQSASHVLRRQRKVPCVDKLCHITTPNAVCLSKQKLWVEAREPQRGNLRPTHMFLHVRGSSLWKGLLTGENKSLSFCGSLFNIQEGFQWVYWEIRVPYVPFAQQLWCGDTHHSHNPEQPRSCSSSLAALAPGLGGSLAACAMNS